MKTKSNLSNPVLPGKVPVLPKLRIKNLPRGISQPKFRAVWKRDNAGNVIIDKNGFRVYDVDTSRYKLVFGKKFVGTTGKPFAKLFRNREEIESYIWPEAAATVASKLAQQRPTPQAPLEIAKAIDPASKFKISFAEVSALTVAVERLTKYCSRSEAPIKIAAAIDYYIERHYPKGGLRSISEVIGEAIAIKRRDGRRDATVAGYERRWKRFMRVIGDKSISQITRLDCEKFFDSIRLEGLQKYGDKSGAGTPNKLRTGLTAAGLSSEVKNLSPLFGFAVVKGYMAENPLNNYDLEEHENEEPPATVTIEDAAKLLHYVPQYGLLGYVLLGLFAGLRPWETMRVEWIYNTKKGASFKVVDLDKKELSMPASWAKTKFSRKIELEPCAVEWFKLLDRKSPLVETGKWGNPSYNLRNRLEQLRNKMNWKTWPKDILRHSYASYWLGTFHDTAKLALAMGHRSVTMIFDHYRDAFSEKDAAPYWKLTPTKVYQLSKKW